MYLEVKEADCFSTFHTVLKDGRRQHTVQRGVLSLGSSDGWHTKKSCYNEIIDTATG